jgi:hypothetical protein
MRKQTNTLSPSPKGFQRPKFRTRTSEKSADSDSDSDVRKALDSNPKSEIRMARRSNLNDVYSIAIHILQSECQFRHSYE